MQISSGVKFIRAENEGKRTAAALLASGLFYENSEHFTCFSAPCGNLLSESDIDESNRPAERNRLETDVFSSVELESSKRFPPHSAVHGRRVDSHGNCSVRMKTMVALPHSRRHTGSDLSGCTRLVQISAAPSACGLGTETGTGIEDLAKKCRSLLESG